MSVEYVVEKGGKPVSNGPSYVRLLRSTNVAVGSCYGKKATGFTGEKRRDVFKGFARDQTDSPPIVEARLVHSRLYRDLVPGRIRRQMKLIAQDSYEKVVQQKFPVRLFPLRTVTTSWQRKFEGVGGRPLSVEHGHT